jgi:hypothetical protein
MAKTHRSFVTDKTTYITRPLRNEYRMTSTEAMNCTMESHPLDTGDEDPSTQDSMDFEQQECQQATQEVYKGYFLWILPPLTPAPDRDNVLEILTILTSHGQNRNPQHRRPIAQRAKIKEQTKIRKLPNGTAHL